MRITSALLSIDLVAACGNDHNGHIADAPLIFDAPALQTPFGTHGVASLQELAAAARGIRAHRTRTQPALASRFGHAHMSVTHRAHHR